MEDVNAQNLEREIHWLSDVIDKRFKLTFETSYSEQKKGEGIYVVQPPELVHEDSFFAEFIRENDLSYNNRLLLILSLAPHIAPQLLDKKIPKRTDRSGRPLSEMGGVVGTTYRGFIPTGLTYLFLVAGYDIPLRLSLINALEDGNPLTSNRIINFMSTEPGEPLLNGVLMLNESFLKACVTNKVVLESALID